MHTYTRIYIGDFGYMFTAKENDMRESSIESKFRDEVKEVGGMAYKFVSPGNAGVPDRVVILQGGESGFVELTRPGEK